jgi:hypothetical protein
MIMVQAFATFAAERFVAGTAVHKANIVSCLAIGAPT